MTRTLVAVMLLSLHAHPRLEAQSTAGRDPSAGSSPGDVARMPAAERARVEAYGEAFARGIGASPADRPGIAREVFSAAALDEYGIERLTGLFERLRNDLGEVEFDNAELAEVDIGTGVSRILHVYVRSPIEERWKDLQLRLESDPPYRIQQLGFVASVAEPVYLPNGAVTDPATLAWLDGYVDRLVADEGLSGSILIARGSEPLFERVFGHEDAAASRPVSTDTRFNLGSGNKMITALVTAWLAEQGHLSFDDPIGRFFPDLFDADTRSRVTVHHLLAHTSGIADYWTPAYERAWRSLDDLEAMLPFVSEAGIEAEPGTRWAYSNSNYLLLGLVIERVTGQSWFDVVDRMIHAPLGMTATGSFRDEGSRAGRADPLVRAGEGWRRAELPLRGSSAGGGYSTARDMLRFIRGVVDGRVVSPATLERMTRSQQDGLPSPTRYGYGFILEEHEGVRSFGHGGTANGINFDLRYFPAEDITLIVFSNQDNGAFDDLRRNAVRLVTGER